ncbi:helix-turn-helix domain-containing protein [Lacihabitans sp. LS3-19]|uniref:helix-turn-helix domain-containing protein n=1 Tax=Lacihabitans sp. LS3-19 TaxID=2487335 RepID=UPI0020CC2F01|nr:helix-turn-helix domain-containing protein [Lacihabitans sp. LS3-19]MCP9766487.1 helix-turn-helix domain-containing protein [Lacihabitans sp. LS3-19]
MANLKLLIFEKIFQEMGRGLGFNYLKISRLYLFIIGLLSICINLNAQLKIEVEVVSPLIDPNRPLYLAVDYNKWNPSDPKFILKKESDNIYSIVLDNPPAAFEYKFTQGSWMIVEGTPESEGLPNRNYDAKSNTTNFIKTAILGWEKQVAYDITLESIPENTPKDAQIFVTGNFNNWEPSNSEYELKKNIQGQFYIRIYTDLEQLEFKFTRGDWGSVEARESGKARPNRIIFRTSDIDNRNVKISIDGWEDLLGTLHVYSLFDFLLLFSVFQGFLLIIAIPIIQNSNVEANRWLILSIIISSFGTFFYIISNFQSFVNFYPRLVLIPDFLYFIYAPVYYFYLLKLLFNVKFLPSRWYLHFLPLLVQFFVYLPLLLKNDKTFLVELMDQKSNFLWVFAGSGFLGLIWNAYYWNLFRKTINTYKQEFQINLSYEQNLNYLNTVLIIQFIALCFWAFSLISMVAGWYFKFDNIRLTEISVDLTWLVFSLIIYFVGYFAIHQSETFKARPQKISIFDDMLDTTTIGHHKILSQETESFQKEIEKLENFILENQPFKNPKISLNELATQVDIQAHVLSKIINEHYNQNFFDFINSYRVEEFKRMIKEPEYHNLTFLGLAYEVGFNSKTAFNRSFKKITNQTPREYLESLKDN